MTHFPTLSSFTLPSGGLHTLENAKGHQLTCHQGCLWITLDHDLRDIILEAGQSFTLPSQRRAVVYALEASRGVVRPLPAPVPAARGPLAAQAA